MKTLEEFRENYRRDIARNYEYFTRDEDRRRGKERARMRSSTSETLVYDVYGKEDITKQELRDRENYRQNNKVKITLTELIELHEYLKYVMVNEICEQNELADAINAKFSLYGLRTEFSLNEVYLFSDECKNKCTLNIGHVFCKCRKEIPCT